MIKTLLLVFLFFSVSANAQNTVTIGILSDGNDKQAFVPREVLLKEIRKLLEPQYKVTFQELKGGWNKTQIEHTLKSALNQTNIDLIITAGLVGTHLAGKQAHLNKPVIGSFVPDPHLQGIPITPNKTSGKHNFTYMSSLQSFAQDMEKVFAILPGNRFALVADQLILDGIPMLANREFYEGHELDVITIKDSVEDAINKLPENLDAILVAPLLRFTQDDIRQFADTLIERKIPSVSFAGVSDTQHGLLLSFGTLPSENLRLARRVALNIMNVLNGKNAANLRVQTKWGDSIQYNSDTAHAIGFEMPWELALFSNEFHAQPDEQQGLSLNDAVNLALDHNLSLATQRLNVNIADLDLIAARAAWWPQLNLNAQVTQLDEAVTSSVNPEGSVDANVTLSQLLYSESAKSGLDIAKLTTKRNQYQLNSLVLDTISQVSTAYLSVLRAQAIEEVQRSNLKASIQNLGLSENRFRLGAVTETDVLRWKNQIATDKQNVLSAQTDVRNAIVTLQTLLHQPISLNVIFNKQQTKKLVEQTLSPETRKIFDTPNLRHTLQDWIIYNALNNAPEIKENQTLTSISQRQKKAAKRAFYLPDISLNGQKNHNLDRYGLNSAAANNHLTDDSWSVNVIASYPLFQGKKRTATYKKAKQQLKQAELHALLTKDNITASAWSAWNRVAASYPSILLSQQSANAARQNLKLIREQYSSGSINITTLIDAQNSALAAKLVAAQAEYAYLIDMVGLMRAISDFRFFTDPNHSEVWFSEFYAFKHQQELEYDKP